MNDRLQVAIVALPQGASISTPSMDPVEVRQCPVGSFFNTPTPVFLYNANVLPPLKAFIPIYLFKAWLTLPALATTLGERRTSHPCHLHVCNSLTHDSSYGRRFGISDMCSLCRYCTIHSKPFHASGWTIILNASSVGSWRIKSCVARPFSTRISCSSMTHSILMTQKEKFMDVLQTVHPVKRSCHCPKKL